MERRTLFDAFNEEFEQQLQRHTKSKEVAFYKADENFVQTHGFKAYSSYESFHQVRSRKAKRG